MKVVISTKVDQKPKDVWARFDKSLFLKLNPPFPKVTLSRFDGCKKGDNVWLTLNFLLFKLEWRSLITECSENENSFAFIDVGIDLPFFIKEWKHTHSIQGHKNGSVIGDHVEYKSPFWAMDFLLFPLLYLQFLYRKPIYKKCFSRFKSVT